MSVLMFAFFLLCPAQAGGAPPIRPWSQDARFDLTPSAPMYLGAKQWAYVMTPVEPDKTSLFQGALLEGTRLARLRLQEMGLFQERETEGSVQIYQWPEAPLGDALVQVLMPGKRLSLQGLYVPYPPGFSVIVVHGDVPDQRVWSTLVHEIAHHWYASACRRGPWTRDASEAFAEAVEDSVMTLDDWRRLPKERRYRPPAPKAAAPAMTVSAHIEPLDLTISFTATFD